MKKVLVVDDCSVNLCLLAAILKKEGCKTDTAKDGVEAFSKATNNNYDLIFTDIRMPNMNGYELSKKLREKGYEKPIIAVTSEKDSRTREEAGIDGYIKKPIQSEKFKNLLRYCV